ncbi:hypothetical protein AXFE_20200 [Acidithrix ferrooxidans]|uniref:Uncharacterized protein n=1 Tax=Acidithrix ferrooxidans TaxID=1280514 RepID=A0A0D8HH52_9ACTN|nr:hypothetical protein AXFE_20200 [Acidithrix ferrooxidans]CAG4915384.1 unnamed protein product [Acidithrix sp. C25]
MAIVTLIEKVTRLTETIWEKAMSHLKKEARHWATSTAFNFEELDEDISRAVRILA